jgi:hypothetical protein
MGTSKRSEDALLRGPLLIEAQRWFDQRSQDLSDQERIFITASRELRERLELEEKKRQERDLEAAQLLGRTETARANEAEKRLRTEEELRWREVEGAQELARTEAKAARSLRAYLDFGNSCFPGRWRSNIRFLATR